MRKLAIYLSLLIPANFFVAWLFGRLELGWVTIPFLALGGAIWITRSAQLDIGFARSVNEIDLVELQPNHPRAHLTRVMALYNSLSTTYQIESEVPEFVFGPVKSDAMEMRSQATDEIELRFGGAGGTIARGISVPSNRTLMYRGEQMISIPGPIALKGEDQVVNSTGWDLEDVTVWWNDQGRLKVAPVGALAASTSSELEFIAAEDFRGWSEAALGGDKIAEAAAKMGSLTPGAMRLIGRIPNTVPGCNISPQSNQTLGQTIVVAHLKYSPLPECQRDLMLPPLQKDRNKLESDGTFEIVN